MKSSSYTGISSSNQVTSSPKLAVSKEVETTSFPLRAILTYRKRGHFKFRNLNVDFHSPGFFTVARLKVSIQTKWTKWTNQTKWN